MTSVIVRDVGDARLVTSGDVDPDLYSFGERTAGVQRLFVYDTDRGRVLIPAIELARFLFLHNRTLANCIMRPGALNLLFIPQTPGLKRHRHVRFTSEMPHRCLSRDFVREFTWLALHPEGRRAWDSVSTQSCGKSYIEFSPPRIKNSRWRFRGVEHQGTWLVLELLSLGGRELPSPIIEYSHPRLIRTVRVHDESDSGHQPNGACSRSERSGKVEQTLVMEDVGDGAGSTLRMAMTHVNTPRPHFENASLVRPILEGERQSRTVRSAPGCEKMDSSSTSITWIRVSAGERTDRMRGNVRPLEFRALEPASVMELGTLELLQETARSIAEAAPHLSVDSAPCFLKAGRSFSVVGRNRRTALVVIIRQRLREPVVLLDVERTGVTALALLALRFRESDTSDEAIETTVQKVLDGLVDRGGFWDTKVENEIKERCECEHLAKALIPRNCGNSNAALWAARLLVRLDLGRSRDGPA
jgi:hypothetical protein